MSGRTGEALIATLGDMVVINLPQRTDRKAEFAAQLDRIGLSFGHGRVRLFPAIRPEDAGAFPTIGTRGCFLSHLDVLRAARDRDAAGVLICEDDLDFARDLEARGPDLLARLRAQPWDIFYGGFSEVPEGHPVDGLGDLLRVPPTEKIVCAHFIAFRRPAIRALVPYLETILTRVPGDPAGGPMHVDGAYARFRAVHPELVTLAAVPELGHQRASRTDIHRLGWRDRLPGVRGALGLARKLRNRVRG